MSVVRKYRSRLGVFVRGGDMWQRNGTDGVNNILNSLVINDSFNAPNVGMYIYIYICICVPVYPYTTSRFFHNAFTPWSQRGELRRGKVAKNSEKTNMICQKSEINGV